MKIRFSFLSAILMIFAMSGCSSTPTRAANPPEKALVVYFSWGGNTRIVAENIKEITGGDIFEILPIQPYTTNRDSIEEQARREVRSNYQPPLKALPTNLDEYDVIYVGSPCWFATITPPIATFMATADLSGKTIIPFMTHGGSKMGRTIEDMKKLAPNATINNGLPIHEKNTQNSMEEIKIWLAEANLIKAN